MIAPALPNNDAKRIEALRQLKILDTPSEDRFDKIVDIVSIFFDVPICFISFIDEKRQWLKSQKGMPLCESSREVSFCGHTINEERALVVPNAKIDARFFDNPLVLGEPHIVFYAGVPLVTLDGYKIGTLCLSDTKPRGFSTENIQRLESFGTLIEDQVNLYLSILLKNRILQQKKDITQKAKHIQDSIDYAQQVQKGILQNEIHFKKLFSNSAIFQLPKDKLSGDFFYAIQINHLKYLVTADCTGHGVPGALVSVTCNNALENAIRLIANEDVGSVLEQTNDYIKARFTNQEDTLKDGMDLFIFCYNELNNTLSYAGANNSAYLIKQETENTPKELIELKATKRPIGYCPYNAPFVTNTLKINSGDTIFMGSDGFQDQFGGERDKKFGKKRLRNLFLEMDQSSIENHSEKLRLVFDQWKNNAEQIDDVIITEVCF